MGAKSLRRLVVPGFLLLVLVACSEGSHKHQAEERATAPPPDSSLSAGVNHQSQSANIPRIALTPALRLPGHESLRSFSSWQQALAANTAEDGKYLEELNSQFLGALGFQNEQEQRDLIRQGFPMPEEWIAAKLMTDGALSRLANEGNLKAQMLFANKVAEQLQSVRGSRGLDLDDPQDRVLFDEASQSMAYITDLLKQRSAFSAYLAGRYYSATSRDHRPNSWRQLCNWPRNSVIRAPVTWLAFTMRRIQDLMRNSS